MAKYTGRGAAIEVRTVESPETWQVVAQVRRIGSISMTAEEIDATTLDTEGDFRSSLAGFKDAGELPLEVIWDPSLDSHGEDAFGLYGLFLDGTNQLFRITIPVNPVKYLRINGYIRDFALPEFNPDDPIASTATIRLSDRPILGNS